jgi:hypothetical protein
MSVRIHINGIYIEYVYCAGSYLSWLVQIFCLFCFVRQQNHSDAKQNPIKVKIFDSDKLRRRIEVVKMFGFVWHQNGSVGKQNQIKMKIFDSHELMRRIEVVKLFGCVWHQNGSVAKQNQTKAFQVGEK